jgi:hypothetical protein
VVKIPRDFQGGPEDFYHFIFSPRKINGYGGDQTADRVYGLLGVARCGKTQAAGQTGR